VIRYALVLCLFLASCAKASDSETCTEIAESPKWLVHMIGGPDADAAYIERCGACDRATLLDDSVIENCDPNRGDL
jgi:hypothetical protein